MGHPVVRLKKEFLEADKDLDSEKARMFARVLSAMGKSTVVKIYWD